MVILVLNLFNIIIFFLGPVELSSLQAKISKIASFLRKNRRLIVVLSDKILTKKNKIWLFLTQKHDVFVELF